MTELERQAVANAIELQGESRLSAIGSLETAEQLHQFTLNYNPNDGVLPCLAIVQHQVCDAGTALYIYWQFSDLLFEPEFRASAAQKKPQWNPVPILEFVEQHFPSGFASSNIHFDPQEAYALNVVQRRNLALNGVHSVLLEPIGSLRVQREWL